LQTVVANPGTSTAGDPWHEHTFNAEPALNGAALHGSRFACCARRANIHGAGGFQQGRRCEVILVYPRYSGTDWVRFAVTRRWEVVFPDGARDLMKQMDRWLDNASADRALAELAARIARNKPPDLAVGCWVADGEFINSELGARFQNRRGEQ
jgi:hypothetical protein